MSLPTNVDTSPHSSANSNMCTCLSAVQYLVPSIHIYIMETVTKIVYGDKYLPDLVKLAITVGSGAGSAVLFGGLYYGYNNHNRIIKQ